MASSAYTRLCSEVLFPLHERLKGHASLRIRRELETTQWWPAQRLQELQLARLRNLLQAAQQQVPYYRKLFAEHRFEPATVSSIADLERLPFLTKALIRANLERLRATNAKHLARSNTGGSSGEPLIFFLGKNRVAHDVAAKWRATRWWGVDIGDPEIVVWGSPIELGAQDRLRSPRDKLLRTRLLPAFEMSHEKLDRFVAEICQMRPTMLFGYPSALAHIARHVRTTGQRVDNLGIKVAFVTSERLYEDQRTIIAETFGCRVANGYGGRDGGFIAHECPDGELHITAEDIIVEIVDEQGKRLPEGQSGEIVVTHLATADFPFVRYRTGDVGLVSNRPCTCGRGLAILSDIQGRTTEFVVAENGTIMHGLALIYVLRALPGIASFKIVQESLSRTRVLIVPDAGFAAETRATIEHGLRERLGAQVDIAIDIVSQIPSERSGKFRYVVSHVLA